MAKFIKQFEKSVKCNWDSIAIIDKNDIATTYHELAERINRNHLIWKDCCLCSGDKIAICTKNCTNFIEIFMSIITGGYVAVLIPNYLSSEDIFSFVEHSDCKLLYTDKAIVDATNLEKLRSKTLIINIKDNSLFLHKGQLDSLSSNEGNNTDCSLIRENISYTVKDINDICSILYTSGSSGRPKGVMISFRNFDRAIALDLDVAPYHNGDNCVSTLPFAHRLGLEFEILVPLCTGMKIILPKRPNPVYMEKIFNKYRPKVICTVPQVLNNYIKYVIGDDLSIARQTYQVRETTNSVEFQNRFISFLGGDVKAILSGGAATNDAAECLLASIENMPFVSGYGQTEVTPISQIKIGCHKLKSSGFICSDISVRIIKNNRGSIDGEIQIQDDGLFAGYYKDPVATAEAYTDDGWYKTGDIGYIDKDNCLYITGRCKEMLLTSNGENIYPENIESILNSMPYVKESLVIQRGEKLHALIILDQDEVLAAGVCEPSVNEILSNTIAEVNTKVPAFSIISSFEVYEKQFERTEKGNYKRFLYK